MQNKRVFPLKNIKKDSCVVLYGAGNNGCEMLEQNKILHWCSIPFAVDKNYQELKYFPVNVEAPEVLKERVYDYVLITIENPDIRKQIYFDLRNLGIEEKKIVIDIDYFITNDVCGDIVVRKDGICREKKLTIGFLPGGVMGDNIISLRLYQELARLAPDSFIDVFTTFKGFPEHIFWGQKNLRKINHRRPEESDRYRYDLIIQSHFEPSLIYCNLHRMEPMAPQLAECVMKLYAYQTSDFFMCYPAQYMNRLQWDRSRFLGYNCYTLLGSSGAFDIKDHAIDFPVDENYADEYLSLGLTEKYITFSYGVSDPLKNGKQQTKRCQTGIRLITSPRSTVSALPPSASQKTPAPLCRTPYPGGRFYSTSSPDATARPRWEECHGGLPLRCRPPGSAHR